MTQKNNPIDYQDGLKGSLSSEVNILSLIELAGRHMKSGALTIYGQEGTASIFFNSGILVNANYEELKGLDALVEILGWHQGHFMFKDGLRTKEINIGSDYNSALLNAVQKLDEKNFAISTVTNLLDKAGEKPASNPLRKHLEDFLKIDDVTMAVVVGRDGFIIDAVSLINPNVEKIGAVISKDVAHSESVGVDLGVGKMKQGMVEYENGIIITNAIGDEAVLILVSTPNVNLGLVRFHIKKRINSIEASM